MWSTHTSLQMFFYAAVLTHAVVAKKCHPWCALNSATWQRRCNWELCAECTECGECVFMLCTVEENPCVRRHYPVTHALTRETTVAIAAPTTGTVASCTSSCLERGEPWEVKCTLSNCIGCEQCGGHLSTGEANSGVYCSTMFTYPS